jgi:hypothetical protein
MMAAAQAKLIGAGWGSPAICLLAEVAPAVLQVLL